MPDTPAVPEALVERAEQALWAEWMLDEHVVHAATDLGADDGPRFKSTTRWANGAELVIEKFPAPDLLEASCRAASAARVLWPDEDLPIEQRLRSAPARPIPHERTTMNIPDILPTLHPGAHGPGDGRLCPMEAAAWMAAEPHSDHPRCVHPVIAEMVRVVSDRMGDDERQDMWPLIIRCLGTASDDLVLAVNLAIWCAQQVLSIFEDERPDDDRPRNAIEAAREWAECPCDTHDHAAANAANAAYAANYAAYAAAAYAAYAANDQIGLLAGLLDEYDRLTGRTEYVAPSEDAWDRVLAAGAR